MLVFAALALAVSQEIVDVPPPRPVPAELATVFAGAIRKNPAFAPAKGRVIQPSMQGALLPDAPHPSWIVEVQWKENGTLHSGVVFMLDIPAAQIPPEAQAQARAMREGPWIAAKVIEGQTFASWAEEAAVQRRDNFESMAQSAIRTMIVYQVSFMSESGGSFAEMRCLTAPASCLPGSTWKAIDPEYARPERYGYRRTLHPGPAVKGKPGLIATYAYTAVPMDPKYGGRAYCGDSSGYVCEVVGAAMPPVVGGVCPKSCKRTE